MVKNLKSIGARAFTNCYSLRNVKLPEGVESIDKEAFYNCVNLKMWFCQTVLKVLAKMLFMEQR